MSKKQIQIALRLLVSAGLISVLLIKVIDWNQMREIFQQVNLYYLILTVLLSFIMILVSTWKWKILLSAHEITFPLNKLFFFYLVGYFFTNFLPSNIGGDAVRGYEVAKRANNRYAQVFSAIFMERFTGLAVLIAMTAAAPLISPYISENTYLMVMIILVSAFFFLFAFFLFNRGLLQKIKGKVAFNGAEVIKKKLGNFYNAIYFFKEKKDTLSKVMFISGIFYLLTVVNVLLGAMVFDISISVRDVFAMTPIVMIISMIPITISGIGLSEGAYVYCFSLIGVSAPEAFSIALLMRVKLILIGLIGGVVFASLRQGVSPAELKESIFNT